MTSLAATHAIASKIYFLRGEKVLFDFDLALLYGVKTKALKQAVRRNIDRFPEDFMFILSDVEFANLRSQFVTSSWGGQRYPPFAFTEHGVAMLSSILNSNSAIQVNIAIIRTFLELRRLMNLNKGLADRIQEMERKYDSQFKAVFDAIRQLIENETKVMRPIGFMIRSKKRK